MSIEEEIEEWKRRWEAKGLPKALLDELAEEARREWDIELGYRETKLYYDLIVNVVDPNHQVGDKYKYTILMDSDVIRGVLTEALTQTFPQLPAEALTIEVFKLNSLGACVGHGSKSIILTNNMSVNVEIIKEVVGAIFGEIIKAEAEEVETVKIEIPPLPYSYIQSEQVEMVET